MSKVEFRFGSSPPNPGGAANPFRDTREQLEQAETLRQQRSFDRAESICTTLLRKHPDYFGALHTLGLIYADRGDYRRALVPLVNAAMLNPRSWMTHTALAGVYLRLDAKEMAAHTLEQARSIKPSDPTILVTLGEVYREEREFELARDVFREAIVVEPDMEEAVLGLSMAYASLDDNIKAAETLDTLLNRSTASLGALTTLITLPSSAIKRDVLADLGRVAPVQGPDKGQFDTAVAFVKVAALDKAERYDDAWRQTVIANRLVLPNVKNDLMTQVSDRQTRLKWLRDISTKAKLPEHGDDKQPMSLFILGSSRSGKTTMERLVATLDGVKRGFENPSVENAISRSYQAVGLITAYSLGYLPPQFYSIVREVYAEELLQRCGASVKVFTNTHPAHISDAGHITVILPNVRFLFIKRNTDDLMLRIYQRQYQRGNPYSYDLRAIRAHVQWYNEMIDLMAEKFPDIVRVVHYEDMVADPAAALRVAADLCGLPMTDKPLPAVGDDRGCSAPYRDLMAAELAK